MATKRERELERLLRQERARSERLEKKLDEMMERQEQMQAEIRDLVRKLNEALRAAKRQAAPFARRKRKAQRREPGRKVGHEGASQVVADNVDEEFFEPLEMCPCCGGTVDEVRDHEQFVVDLPPVKAHVTRIVTQSGHCARCDRRVRTQHPAQVSTATGAARVSLGPNVLGLAADLKHRYGMAYRDVAELIGKYFGIRVTHGAFVYSSIRLAKRGKVTYEALVSLARESPVVHTNDTGWRIDSESASLWVFATAAITIYVVAKGRGANVVTDMLGTDFDGILVSDGLPALDSLDYERAQCFGHLIRRAAKMAAIPGARDRWYPLAIMRDLQAVLALRLRRDELSASHYRRLCRQTERRRDRMLRGPLSDPDNEHLRRHLANHRNQLLICLYTRSSSPRTTSLSASFAVPSSFASLAVAIAAMLMLRPMPSSHRSRRPRTGKAARQGSTLTDFVRGWLRPRPQAALS